MTEKHQISEKWIKASIIGTIWAASEIVIGSFLHNLRLPLSGKLLTAIAIIILVSVSYVWKEKGLFWRSGLICALLKTMSPSAVIFGPMIAILSEAILLEISVRIFRKTFLGFIVGAMLAMSWNLFQKIFNLILFYGFNIVEVYTEMLTYAQKQLHTRLDMVWLPILILLAIYCLLGVVSAIIGIRVGRKIQQQPDIFKPLNNSFGYKQQTGNIKQPFEYSLAWLLADFILLIGSLVILNLGSWMYWGSVIIVVIAIWVYRYKRALRQLSKPKFWISFVIITMITAFVFSKIQSEDLIKGLMIGIQMNFRAAVVIVGFSVLGTELYNPKIRNFFMKTSLKQLPLAMELSLESLPSMIANIPEFKVFIKNPVSVIHQLISQAEYRLDEIKNIRTRKVFIITGPVGYGKTNLIVEIIETLREQNINVGGIFSERVMEGQITTGYDVVDIASQNREPFLRISDDEKLDPIGRFRIYPQGLQMGSDALLDAKNSSSKLIVIDEIGKLELNGQGWANEINQLVSSTNKHLLLSVRGGLTDQIIQKWNLTGASVFDISIDENSAIINAIMKQMENV